MPCSRGTAVIATVKDLNAAEVIPTTPSFNVPLWPVQDIEGLRERQWSITNIVEPILAEHIFLRNYLWHLGFKSVFRI